MTSRHKPHRTMGEYLLPAGIVAMAVISGFAGLRGITTPANDISTVTSSRGATPAVAGGVGLSFTVTVTLTAPAAPGGGIPVTLASSNTAVRVNGGASAIVTIPKNGTSANFTITAPNDVASNVAAILTASESHGTGSSGTIGVTVRPFVKSVVVDAAKGRAFGGNPLSGTVTVEEAPPANITVNMASDSANAAVSNVTILSGTTTANFDVTTTSVDAAEAVTITASHTATNTSSATDTFDLLPAHLGAIFFNPTVVGGDDLEVTVQFTGPVTEDKTVALTSNRTAEIPNFGNVTVLAGNRTAVVNVPTNVVSKDTAVKLIGNDGVVTRERKTMVLAPFQLSIMPDTITGGGSSTVTITLPAPANGDKTFNVSCSNTKFFSVPATVTVLDGDTSASFPVNTNATTLERSSKITVNGLGAQSFVKLTITP